MEIKSNSLNSVEKSHPNFIRWQRARELSAERGKLVKSIINQVINLEGLKILDLGSGEGGTSRVLAQNNFIVSYDLNISRLKRQTGSELNNIKVNGDATQLPFADKSFDVIILQDVIEHLAGLETLYDELLRVLKDDGTIYLSTPNKLSIINLFSDPHFGLPLISILKRDTIKKYFLKYFRKQDYFRNDIAQLLSMKEIIEIFNPDFKLKLNTKFVVNELFNGNKGVVWSDLHLKLIALIKKLKIDWTVKKMSNNSFGIINTYFTPTFYFVLSRKL
jgi:2-polyprenyl-3-methyl-5-hydroxy-6-metoxy-1,4-benzoquinol methylase